MSPIITLFSPPILASILLIRFVDAFEYSLLPLRSTIKRNPASSRLCQRVNVLSPKLKSNGRWQRNSNTKFPLSSSSAEFGEGNDSKENANTNLLSYLSNEGKDLPPDMAELLKRATAEYIYGVNNDREIAHVEDVMEALDLEYKISDRPIVVGNVTLNEERGVANEDEMWVYRIFSVALFHKIPAPIASRLLLRHFEESPSLLVEDDFVEDDDLLGFCRKALESDGWKAVSFPDGFRVQIRPGYSCSTWNSYLPPRKVSKVEAGQMIMEADQTKLPEKVPFSPPRQEVQDTLGEDLSNNSSISTASNQFVPRLEDNLPYFPKKSAWRRAVQNFQQIMQKQVQMLKKAGRAGAISYGFLNFALYAGGTVWQWNRVFASGAGLSAQFRKLGRVLGTVYIGSQVTKLPRIALAVVLAPVGDTILIFLQEQLGVTENRAFAILTVGLIAFFIGLLAFVTIGSTLLAP